MKKKSDDRAATKSDIARLEKTTAENLKNSLKYYPTTFEMDQKFQEQDDKMRDYRDQVLTGIDGVMKELQDMREENAAATLHFERLDKTTNNHEKRIKHLESPRAA